MRKWAIAKGRAAMFATRAMLVVWDVEWALVLVSEYMVKTLKYEGKSKDE